MVEHIPSFVSSISQVSSISSLNFAYLLTCGYPYSYEIPPEDGRCKLWTFILLIK